MKGYRFFLEYPDAKSKRKGTVKNPGPHSGNVVAISTDLKPYSAGDGEIKQEGYTAVFDHPDSSVCWSSATWGYLRQQCRRIPEALARTIHPQLFKRLAEDAERDKQEAKKEKLKK